MRMSVARVAIMLERVRHAGMEEEADALRAHLDSSASDDKMVDAMIQSARAQEVMNVTLAAWKPTIDGSNMALTRMADVEARRLEMETEDREDRRAGRDLRYQHIIVPIVAALGGAFTAWAAGALGG